MVVTCPAAYMSELYRFSRVLTAVCTGLGQALRSSGLPNFSQSLSLCKHLFFVRWSIAPLTLSWPCTNSPSMPVADQD